MKKFWMHWRVTGALARYSLPVALTGGFCSRNSKSKRPLRRHRPNCVPRTLRAPLAAQMETLMGGLEYLARSLAVLHEHDPQHTFQLARPTPLRRSRRAVFFANRGGRPSGRIVYSSLSPDSATLGTSIGDRPHFQAHTGRRKSASTLAAPHWAGCRGSGRCKCLTYQPRQPLWRRGGAFHQPGLPRPITCAMYSPRATTQHCCCVLMGRISRDPTIKMR